MTRTISIGSVKHHEKLAQMLRRIQEEKKSEIVLLEETRGEGYKFFKFVIPGERVKSLAELVTNIITDSWEKINISNIIRNHYYYFSPEERKIIQQKALEILRNKNNISETYINKRRSKIKDKIASYLEEHDKMILEGFVKFRLKNYCYELELAVEEAVDEHIMEKEYDEFIRLLKYFVDIQEPKMNMVEIILEENGFFRMYDEEYRIINNEYLEAFIFEMMEEDANYEDLLISALITMAPEKIILHRPARIENGSTLSTIKSVFGERMKECKGCGKCSYLNQNKS